MEDAVDVKEEVLIVNEDDTNKDSSDQEPENPQALTFSELNIIPSDLPASQILAIARATREQDHRLIPLLYLRGYSILDIARETSSSNTDVLAIIKAHRKEVASWHKDELEALRSERIEGLRQVQQRAWFEYDSAKPGTKAQLLTLISKNEMDIARMQGVVEHKVKHSGDIDHHHKTYDFDNSEFPEAAIVEGEVKALPSGEE